MKVNRRDVVNVVFGSNTKQNHLVIVLSPEEVNSAEEQFVGMMITDSTYYDAANEFSFPLTDAMFIKPLKEKASKVRLYLISFIDAKCIIDPPFNQMKIDAFKEMITHLNSKIFGVEF